MSATYRGLSWEGCPSVGWEAIILATASSKLPLLRPARFLLFKSNPFTLLLRGVGSKSARYAAMLERLGTQPSVRSPIRRTKRAGSSAISFALGVGSKSRHNPHPVPAVGRTDSASRNKKRLDGITRVFEVLADGFEGVGLSHPRDRVVIFSE